MEYLDSRCETDSLNFKSEFNPNSNQDWCELLKDIAAIANSGGGIIAIGLNDDGTSSPPDIKPVLALDPADVCNKVEKYTGCCHADFRLVEAKVNEGALDSSGGVGRFQPEHRRRDRSHC